MSNLTLALSALTGGAAGALDAVDGSSLSGGDAAVVVLSGLSYHYHLDASSGATEDSPYVIAPDSNPGTKRWVLATPQGAVSHVVAQGSTTTISDAAYTKIIQPTVIEDALSEYNSTTGVFTARHSGVYAVSFGFQVASYTVAAGDIALGKVTVDGTDVRKGVQWVAQAAHTIAITRTYSFPVHVAASDDVDVSAYVSSGASRNLSGDAYYNWLTIDRLM